MGIELIGRGNINVTKTHLDAAFLTKMGLLAEAIWICLLQSCKADSKGKRRS